MTEIPVLQANTAVAAARSKWRYTGKQRPPFAESSGPGQESVWDYPRPPRCESVAARVEIRTQGVVLASSTAAQRVLETAGAPTYYLPPADVDLAALRFTEQYSLCEWKGRAQTFDVAVAGAQPIVGAGWRYVEMFPEFLHLHEWCAFYPQHLACFVGDQRVTPQPGGYYGGWVTPDLVGPIKGAQNSAGW